MHMATHSQTHIETGQRKCCYLLGGWQAKDTRRGESVLEGGSVMSRPGNSNISKFLCHCQSTDRSQQTAARHNTITNKAYEMHTLNFWKKSIKYTPWWFVAEKPRIRSKIKPKPKHSSKSRDRASPPSLQLVSKCAHTPECLAFICIWAWRMRLCGRKMRKCGCLFVCAFVWVCKYLKAPYCFLYVVRSRHSGKYHRF